MIDLFIFHIHIVAALYAFTKRWRESNLKEGALAVIIIGLVFTIGWVITSAIAGIMTPAEGFFTWLSRDTVSLTLLVALEAFVYKLLFLQPASAGGA